MTEPRIAQAAPFAVDVEAEKSYWWCACGLSKSQPFCDGSHRQTDLLPVQFVAPRSERLWFCGCKRSADAPWCDGAHRKLAAASAALRVASAPGLRAVAAATGGAGA